MKIVPFFLFLFVLTFSALCDYSPNLPLNSEIDNFMYRLSSRYGLKLPASIFFETIDYKTVADFLLSADSIDSVKLSSDELYRLEKILNRIDKKSGILKWSSQTKNINLKVQLSLIGQINSGFMDSLTTAMRGIIGPSFYGNIGNLSFYSGINVWTEYRSDTLFPMSSYQPYDGIPYNLYGRNSFSSHIRSSDLPRGGIKYDFGLIKLETALDYLKIGPAVYYPVTLSGTAPPITYFRGSFDLGILNYNHVVGLLRDQKDKTKFIYAHRLSAELWKSRLNIGINELIITGDFTTEPHNDTNTVQVNVPAERDWEWPYFIPFLPFKFVEHYSGDRDNAALSFDADLVWPKNFRWYLEFFLDDILSPWTIFKNDWGNKWAASVGAQYFGSVIDHDFSLNAEYSHVEPWVYTHFYGGSHRYSHFNSCLGSPLGPNSQSIVFESKLRLNKLHEIGIGLTSLATNQSVRGGKITDIFQFPDFSDSTRFFDSTQKRFLGPGTKWTLKPSISWEFNPFGLFTVNAKYEISLLENRGESNLFLWGGFTF